MNTSPFRTEIEKSTHLIIDGQRITPGILARITGISVQGASWRIRKYKQGKITKAKLLAKGRLAGPGKGELPSKEIFVDDYEQSLLDKIPGPTEYERANGLV